MSGLNFLQAMSNTAAENVSGPIDMLGWALRKAGIPVPQDAMLSSDWMRKKGLIVDVPQDASSLAGQTAGLLAPLAAVAKAPQIAKGLLQAGDNLAAPTMAGPAAAQRGAIVYHGSPHKFDRFDASKIGTGEGAQAYGYGLYLAETPDVATRYRDTLTNFRPDHIEAKLIEAGISPEFANTYAQFAAQTKGGARGFDDFAELMAKPGPSPYIEQFRQRIRAEMPAARTAGDAIAGSLYKVDLPDEHIAKMLDWDKPLSQQAPEVQRVANDIYQGLDKDARRLVGDSLMDLRGSKLYELIASDDAYAGAGQFGVAASTALKGKGIPGIRYLDGGSRGAGTGTSNYVVFPGNEDLLKILERNGQPLGLLSP